MARADATTSRWWSARSRRRPISTRSAWASRWRTSGRRGCAPSPTRSRRWRSRRRRAGGGLASLPVPVSTPGFDAAPYLTATLCITRDPDNGIQNMGMYRAALKATDRLAVRMVARPSGGAGGYYHWIKYNKRREPMAMAIVIGCAPAVVFTGPQKLAIDLDE